MAMFCDVFLLDKSVDEEGLLTHLYHLYMCYVTTFLGIYKEMPSWKCFI